ncbi:MAG: DEAD/DEAH box helicase [Myxococcaceae bacterium]|jgi:adenine-specific DNA-methyltransferase|nr:DEAD/DEAH box helicase [Myxococcaceae bacterium]
MAPRLHPLQLRYAAEELVRLRRADEARRAAAPHRAARIDPNPHQVDAVVFALSRLREGGCILADEVGLGKTIEAGLVITQLLAEGARRVLLIAPKSLVGQWRDELFTLFDLPTKEGRAQPGGFEGEGVFLVNREAAGSTRGHEALLASPPFDLCVIDEAHELFAGIYKRFTPAGDYDDASEHARTAGRVREVLSASQTPVLLLTATPIQNNLAELWGLVQYVDPSGTLLGDLPTFRQVFCGADDRQLAPGLETELRARLKTVLQRTLRRQAQAFLEKPFVRREARLFEYAMSPAERALTDDVTKYLLSPGLHAFQGRQRKLLLLGFLRRMASSSRALASSLENVAARLEKVARGETPKEDDAAEVMADLDGLDVDDLGEVDVGDAPKGDVLAELELVRSFAKRARGLERDDGRFRALLKALTFVDARAKAGQGSNKLVVFTESVATQEYLREALVGSGLLGDDEVTLFRGDNDTPRAAKALERWRAEVPLEGKAPSHDIALRLALVHEFKTRSRVFISTEAGAKGLNLQFCNAVVNWDLPWNPQRIEQRIGRCHRYGQAHDVTVINFTATGNEAQQLTFDILSQKLDLFGTVLSASDEVLHRSSGPDAGLVSVVGAGFEAELASIYERARTLDEVTAELRAMRERFEAERREYEATRQRTIGVIEQRFDEDVQRVFKLRRDALPGSLAALDHELAFLVEAFLDAVGVSFRRRAEGVGEVLEWEAHPSLPEGLRGGGVVRLGDGRGHPPLHLGHPLVTAAVAYARAPRSVRRVVAKGPSGLGRLRLVKATFDGFERVEVLVPVLVRADGSVASDDEVRAVLMGPLSDVEGVADESSEERSSTTSRSGATGEESQHAAGGRPRPFPSEPGAVDEATRSGQPSPRSSLSGDVVPGAAQRSSSIEETTRPGAEARPVDDASMLDAQELRLFEVQASVDAEEHRRFEAAALQAQRFLDDRLVVLRRRRDEVSQKLAAAEARWEGSTGADARTAAEADKRRHAAELERLEGRIAQVLAREDERYRRSMAHLEARRYTPPTVEVLFDVDVVFR